MERCGAVVKRRTRDREVPGSIPTDCKCCFLEQETLSTLLSTGFYPGKKRATWKISTRLLNVLPSINKIDYYYYYYYYFMTVWIPYINLLNLSWIKISIFEKYGGFKFTSESICIMSVRFSKDMIVQHNIYCRFTDIGSMLCYVVLKHELFHRPATSDSIFRTQVTFNVMVPQK